MVLGLAARLMRSWCLAALMLPGAMVLLVGAQVADVPEFRQPGTADVSASLRKVRSIRFSIDETMPPFAYRNTDGALTGFVPILLDAMCRDLKLSCEFLTRSQSAAVASLDAGDVDAIVSFTGPDSADLGRYDFTRPFLRPFSRFATRIASPISGLTQRDLAGKRVGVRAGTRQEQFLQRYYPRSAIVTFDSHQEMREALRLARIDAMFDDAFRLMFWMQGETSRGCCHFLGHGFGPGTGVSGSISFMLRKPDTDIRKVIDHGLDRLQSSGKFTGIYVRFFPASPY